MGYLDVHVNFEMFKQIDAQNREFIVLDYVGKQKMQDNWTILL